MELAERGTHLRVAAQVDDRIERDDAVIASVWDIQRRHAAHRERHLRVQRARLLDHRR